MKRRSAVTSKRRRNPKVEITSRPSPVIVTRESSSISGSTVFGAILGIAVVGGVIYAATKVKSAVSSAVGGVSKAIDSASSAVANLIPPSSTPATNPNGPTMIGGWQLGPVNPNTLIPYNPAMDTSVSPGQQGQPPVPMPSATTSPFPTLGVPRDAGVMPAVNAAVALANAGVVRGDQLGRTASEVSLGVGPMTYEWARRILQSMGYTNLSQGISTTSNDAFSVASGNPSMVDPAFRTAFRTALSMFQYAFNQARTSNPTWVPPMQIPVDGQLTAPTMTALTNFMRLADSMGADTQSLTGPISSDSSQAWVGTLD